MQVAKSLKRDMKLTVATTILGLGFTLSGTLLPFDVLAYQAYGTTAAPLPFPYTYVPPASDQVPAQAAFGPSMTAQPVAQPTPRLVAPQFPIASSIAPVANNVQTQPLPPVPSPVSLAQMPPMPDPRPVKPISNDQFNLPKKDQPTSTINDAMLPAEVDSSAKTAIDHGWAQEIELLEKENRALRDRLMITDNDGLKDIRVDSVAQIREDVLRARVVDLEKQLDRLSMKNNPGDLPDKTSAAILAAPSRIH